MAALASDSTFVLSIRGQYIIYWILDSCAFYTPVLEDRCFDSMVVAMLFPQNDNTKEPYSLQTYTDAIGIATSKLPYLSVELVPKLKRLD